AVFERRLGRVEDDEIAFGHAAQHVWLTVIGLHVAAAHALFDVIAADGDHPVGHASHARESCRHPGGVRARAVDEIGSVDNVGHTPRWCRWGRSGALAVSPDSASVRICVRITRMRWTPAMLSQPSWTSSMPSTRRGYPVRNAARC